MKRPLISLITVCYNAESLIENTLKSAVSQTYKHFELVIIDGGSTDNTVEVAKKFHPYIGTLISEPDKGIYDAMNKGIKAAKGEWLYFLNAGDSFYDDRVLESIFEETIPQHLLFIYGKVQTVNEPSGVNYITGKPVTLSDFFSHYPICHQATFTHCKAFSTVGAYNTHYKLAADTEWFARLFKQLPQSTLFITQIVAFYDIQGATYHKRMAGYKEYLHFGRKLFPWYISLKNQLLYPFIWLKVKLIRLLQKNVLFKYYRKIKFNNRLVSNPQ